MKFLPRIAKILKRVGMRKAPALLELASVGYLSQTGYLESIASGVPVSHDGRPLPWLTYPCVSFLAPRLTAEMSVFEFGAGNSTLFFSAVVGNVCSVEHDQAWYEILKGKVPGRCRLTFETAEESYLRAPASHGKKLDIVLIDGKWRNRGAHVAPEFLNDSGVVIFDDTDREEYEEGFRSLHTAGFRRIDFWGLAPGSAYLNCTSIFYRSGNCLSI